MKKTLQILGIYRVLMAFDAFLVGTTRFELATIYITVVSNSCIILGDHVPKQSRSFAAFNQL